MAGVAGQPDGGVAVRERGMSEQVQAIGGAVRRLTVEEKREMIESSKGKYRDVATASESFLRRKREDLVLECCRLRKRSLGRR